MLGRPFQTGIELWTYFVYHDQQVLLSQPSLFGERRWISGSYARKEKSVKADNTATEPEGGG